MGGIVFCGFGCWVVMYFWCMQICLYIVVDKFVVILYLFGMVISFDELEVCVNWLVYWFCQVGLCEDDVVVILMENNEYVYVVMWVVCCSGLYYVLINIYLIVFEVVYIVDNSGVKVIVGLVVLCEICYGLVEYFLGGLLDLLMFVGGGLVGWMIYLECVVD